MFQHKWEDCNRDEVVRPCRYHRLERSFYDEAGNVIPNLQHPKACSGYEELIPRGFNIENCSCAYGELSGVEGYAW